jgi:hypothetical protein
MINNCYPWHTCKEAHSEESDNYTLRRYRRTLARNRNEDNSGRHRQKQDV